MAISKGRALSATVNSATSIIKSSIDGTATIATLEQSAQQYANADALPSIGNTFGEMALVQSTNRMYVWNGSGWYNVALINTNPSFTTLPGGNYAFDDDSPRSNIVITVAATDPESLGVSFSFETSGSMDSMADITQDSSVFTLVPKGNDSLTEGAILTGSLTIKASDGVNIVPAVSQFTLTFTTIIANSSGNRLLLKAEASGGANSVFVDSSTSNHTVTGQGTVKQTSFSPFRMGGYSTYFDGSGDWLRDDTIGDAMDATDGSNFCDNFTIELWLWNNDTPASNDYFISSNAVSSGANDFLFGTNRVYWNAIQSGSDYGGSGSSAKAKQYQWQHFVLQHEYNPSSGGVDILTLWIDGSQAFRDTSNSRISFANNTFAFGTEADAGNFGSLGNYFNGYLYDVKITKLALYTSTDLYIPVPTEPSTPHPTANIFHGMQKGTIDPRFTIGGTPHCLTWTPLDYSNYKVANGGSYHFDGNGDYLQIADNADFDLPGEFSYEFWFYRTGSSSGTYQAILGANGSGSSGLAFYITQSSGGLSVYQSDWHFLNAATVEDKTWNHVLLMRDSANLLQLFLNGNRVASATDATAFYDNSSGSGTRIGYDISANGYFKGFITDVRIVKGSTGEYSSGTTITVPAGPLTAITNTKLLLSGTNSKITDRSQFYHFPNLYGNVASSSAQQHFGENTLAFDGNGDRIVLDRAAIPLGDDIDWTIETWVRSPSADATRVDLISQYEASPADGRMGIYFASSKLVFFQSNLSPSSLTGTTDVVNNQWHHVAVTNHVGTRRIYLDGNFEGSVSGTGHMLNTGTVIGDLGNGLTNGAELNGYMHDVRITQGLVRYPYIAKPITLTTTNSGMQKPDGTFPAVSNASNTIFLACHADTIVDGSGNNISITTVGNAAVSSFAPYVVQSEATPTGMKSVFFDGSSDRLDATLGTTLGTADWTIEYWIYHDATTNGNEYHLEFNTSNPLTFYYRDSSNEDLFAMYHLGEIDGGNVWNTFRPQRRKWYHLAWVHYDSTGKVALFVNGAFWGDISYTGNIDSADIEIGGSSLDGNISNLRIVKGQALYTHNFTPRTTAILA